mmetsp:Transcript_3128/g.5142  ORF Transcript_3128/g.5142 Transcript_3128/m.5142 type:complete len:177 (+) Transcript_3128:737-1267(+)
MCFIRRKPRHVICFGGGLDLSSFVELLPAAVALPPSLLFGAAAAAAGFVCCCWSSFGATSFTGTGVSFISKNSSNRRRRWRRGNEIIVCDTHASSIPSLDIIRRRVPDGPPLFIQLTFRHGRAIFDKSGRSIVTAGILDIRWKPFLGHNVNARSGFNPIVNTHEIIPSGIEGSFAG